MSGYRDLTDMLTLIQDGQRTGERYWRRTLRAPQHLIDQAVRMMAEDGYASSEVFALLAPYNTADHERDRATSVRWVQALGDRADLATWEKHRIAITVDDDLWADLGGVADDDVISADVFQYLPYADPYVHFPTPIVVPTATPGISHQVVGTYLCGQRHAVVNGGNTIGAVCSTADPRAVTISFKMAGLITGPDGKVIFSRAQWDESLLIPDLAWTNVALHFERPVMTFAELASQVETRFDKGDVGVLPVLLDAKQSALAAIAVVRRALAFTLYLCCSNADLEVRKPTGKKKTARPGKAGQPKPPVVVRAGFQIGAAIRAYRIERDSGGPQTPTGRKLKPHPRRAHFQRFRYGPGRTLLSQPRYKPMSWVNAGARTRVTTIKPVRG